MYLKHCNHTQARSTGKTLLLLSYKALNDKAPQYIKELVVPYVSKRTNLRSQEKYLLTEKRSQLVSCGKKCFSFVAPKLWNGLPMDIKRAPSVNIFKKALKTYLFQKAYYS